MEKILLTDKQRKWLESLSEEDKHPYQLLVKHVLFIGGYRYEETKINLNKLVEQYKKAHIGSI